MRLGNILTEISFEERAIISEYLCCSNTVLSENFEEWDYSISLNDKINFIALRYPEFNLQNIFPQTEHLSKHFNYPSFFESFFIQPFVWIKIIKEKSIQIHKELEQKEIPYDKYESDIWKFSPEVKLTELECYKRGFFRIQDLSTQTTAKYFSANQGEKWWDCCAGAGGKSLALLDEQRGIELFASDIRTSILDNLKERFKAYNVRNTHIFEANLERLMPQNIPLMDGVIADVSCSGSGTWARTPEHLSHFKTDQIRSYSEKQLKILDNVFPFLKVGKPLIYITCSVFEEENENVIRAFCAKHAVKIETQKYLEGYLNGAENIFLCRMIKEEAIR